jgi:hypothetical protein
MATLNINDPKYYDPFIMTLKENTSINNHTESANLIVHNFGNDTQKNVMKEILKHHKKEGYFASTTLYNLTTLEYYLLKDVINNMQNKRLAKRIWSSI